MIVVCSVSPAMKAPPPMCCQRRNNPPAGRHSFPSLQLFALITSGRAVPPASDRNGCRSKKTPSTQALSGERNVNM